MKSLTKYLFILFCLLTVVCGLYTVSYAEIPRLLNYQGKLTDQQNKPVTDGTYSVTFMIYDVETAGVPLWTETQSVSVSKGIFSVLLGGATNLNLAFDKPYFLEIKVGTEVMSPRQRIASAAYAMRAETAIMADTISDTTKLIPRGTIVMWCGTIDSIPQGWALCDGQNGTPDLRGKFIKSVSDSATNPGKTGGSSTHEHVFLSQLVNGEGSGSNFIGSNLRIYSNSGVNAMQAIYGLDRGDSNPPYYEVAFIIKL